MAYFECIIGGAGTTLTVTCDSVFAGKTITCTDGTTTLTAVCPSASPYIVEFDVETDGTWTISGTVNGKTHSISITLNTSATLHEIPTGSSVTPVANVQTWLHCANIWSKSYTTIAQVLADTSTLLALISSNNAVDYMARSTSWASAVTANSSAMTYIGANSYCTNKLLANSTWLNAIANSSYIESVLNVKVPTMTSNTTPSGEASASSVAGSHYAYWAFNDSTSNDDNWISANGSALPQWIYYKFPNQTRINALFLQNRNEGSAPDVCAVKDFKIQGSNDGTNWTDLGNYTNPSGDQLAIYKVGITNSTKYQYYRLYATSQYTGRYVRVAIQRLQFYGRA